MDTTLKQVFKFNEEITFPVVNNIDLKLLALTSSLTQGKVSFCTIRILNKGSNLPCSNQINHAYKYSPLFIKNSDFAMAGPICSISNISNIKNP